MISEIEEFAGYLRDVERTSDNTVVSYHRDLVQMAAFLEEKGIAEVGKVTKTSLNSYILSLEKAGKAATTISRTLASMKAFFHYEFCEGKIKRNPAELLRAPKVEKKLPAILSVDEVTRLLEQPGDQTPKDLRDKAMLEVMYATGIRVSEVRYITVEAVRQGKAEVSLKGKIRVILLPGKLCRKLLKYAQKQKTASGAIFRTKSGKELGRRQIWAEMKSLCKYAGVMPGKVFPHNLRHMFATVFYRACRDIVKLSDLLGHSSIETTRIYLLTSGAEHQRTLDRLGLIS